jgi:hypothetical protein
MSVVIFLSLYHANFNFNIIVLLGFIIVLLLHPQTPISSYVETDIQSWNPIEHPYASNVRRPLHRFR